MCTSLTSKRKTENMNYENVQMLLKLIIYIQILFFFCVCVGIIYKLMQRINIAPFAFVYHTSACLMPYLLWFGFDVSRTMKGMPMNAPTRPNPLGIPTTWCSVQWSYIFLCLLICFMDIFFIFFTFSSLFISCYSFNHRIIIHCMY